MKKLLSVFLFIPMMSPLTAGEITILPGASVTLTPNEEMRITCAPIDPSLPKCSLVPEPGAKPDSVRDTVWIAIDGTKTFAFVDHSLVGEYTPLYRALDKLAALRTNFVCR